MEYNITLMPYQAKVMSAKEREILLSCGIGSGKTFIGAHWLLSKVISNPGCKLLIGACTYSQLMGVSVKEFIRVLDSFKIPHKTSLSGSRKRIEVNGCLIYLYSLEAPENIRGIEVSYIWVDEAAFSSLNALQVLRGRMRGKNTINQMLLTTSPNGFNFLYDEFVKTQDPSRVLIRGATKENIFIHDKDWYPNLVKQYGGEDSLLARQELFADYVSLQEGAIYNLFSRGINVVECKLNRNYPVYCGVDFNVDKMSATYIQYINGIFYQCKEVQLTHKNANTYDLGMHIKNELVDNGYVVHIVPDSTGKARKTSASSGKTDHQILRDLGLNVMETSNPLIRDRQNNLNIGFLKKTIVIDPSCTKTIEEIEKLSSRDTEGKTAHLSPTLGYVCWKLSPLVMKPKPSRIIHL